MIKGNDIVILKDGVAIAAARSCDVQVNAGTDEVSSPSTGSWRERLVGRKDWTVSVSMLVTSVASLLTQAGSEFTIAVVNRNNASDRVSGQAILTQARVTATRGTLAQGAWTFLGTGAFE